MSGAEITSKDAVERERTAREIAKTRASIRKKYRALKTGKIESEIALERQFKPIVDPSKQIAERGGEPEDDGIVVKKKREESDDDDGEIARETKPKRKRSSAASDVLAIRSAPSEPRRLSRIASDTLAVRSSTPSEPRRLSSREENVFQSPQPSLETSIREASQTPEGREDSQKSELGPSGKRYVDALFFGGDAIDHVYGVYVADDGPMLGDKRFDMRADDSVIVNGVTYKGTPGLYELIFKRHPDDAIYTEDDLHKYRSSSMATNAHKRGHKAENAIKGNKGHKYVDIIAPLVTRGRIGSARKGAGVTGLPSNMRLNRNKIDYVHWDDPNELVDRLRSLDASRRAGNNAHDNEISSIIEELREAGVIIN